MKIVPLSEEYEHAWLHCLEPYASEVSDGVERKREWFARVRDRGLIVKLAIDDDGAVAGMIQALPIEQTWVAGENLYLILCIWVHGHEQGIGNRQGAGMGRALLEALEADVRETGALGIAAWGMALPFWMKAAWFKKQGYRKCDRSGIATLMWKPFTHEAHPPHWAKGKVVPPELEPGKVTVTCFDGGWCPLQSGNCERARRAAQSTGDGVAFRRIDTIEPKTAEQWGQSYAIWIDHHQLMAGPPLREDRIAEAIQKRKRGAWWRRLVRRRATPRDTTPRPNE